MVDKPSQLVNRAVYVAVGNELGGRFQPRDYGLTRLKPDTEAVNVPVSKSVLATAWLLVLRYFN